MTTTAGHSEREPVPAEPPEGPLPSRLRGAWSALGPGLVTGASDDDPSGIATYAQAGAKFGFGLLWTALITLPLMMAIQEICDRMALATGKTLGELARAHFSRWARACIAALVVGLVIANALNVTADLVAIGSGMHLLHAGPASLWALIAGASITALIPLGGFSSIQRVFKVLCLSLLAYLLVLFVAHVPWKTVGADAVIPHVTFFKDYLALLVEVLGTTISPYLFFWQTANRVEEMRAEDAGGDEPMILSRRTTAGAKRKTGNSRFDVFAGMAFSNLIMFAIITATATAVGAHGGKDITSAAGAAEALKPVAGGMAPAVFALGFIGSGMLAIPVLAGAGSVALAGLLGRPWGLSLSVRKAPFFYVLLAVGTVGGTALTLTSIDPITLLVLSATVNGIAAAPFLIVVMIIARNRELMGASRNQGLAAALGWTTVALMSAAAIAMLALLTGL
ncbi:Nramp family divalent metal transporter [Catenulispora sp. GP43]|uniref:Nramp family divalent metal transporter n=1 Tax=Catenulispora sp. GP43 TaxID=3156263 RepID=UPI0035129918